MVAKRTSVSNSKQPAKKFCTGAVSPSPAVSVVDPFLDECSPVLSLLDESMDLSDNCRGMIRTAAPHALKTPKSDRHTYQTEVVDIVAKVITEIEQQRSAAVAEVEGNLASFESSKVGTISAFDTSTQEVQRKKQVTAAATASLKAASDAVKHAKAELQTAKTNEDNLAGEHASNVGKRQEYLDVMSDNWEPLKMGTFGGQQWRERNRAVGVFLEAMAPLNLEESLSDALPVALKTKVDARGKFARLVIEQVEAAMTLFINGLTEKVANVDAVSAERSKTVMAAQASLEVAQEKEKNVMEELVVAENQLLEEETRQHELEQEIQTFGSRQQALAELLEQNKASLSSALEAGKKFEFLRDEAALPTDCTQPAASMVE
jgi:hypothetical protein